MKSALAGITIAASLLLAPAVSPAFALKPADKAAVKQERMQNLLPGKPAGNKSDPPKPTAHRPQNIEGWTVRVDERLFQPTNRAALDRALKFLEAKLADIKLVVSPEIVTKLQAVVIVLDLTHGKLRSMQYHPDLGWLQANGYSTNLVKCVHIPEISDLVTARNVNEQPWVILHELAHAYHDQVLGFEEARILKAYEDYKKSGHGDRALLYDGSRVRHYGLTDQKEFFAEMTESYFGMDDFFPFNRAELMTAEPGIYELMRAIWSPVAGERPVSPQAKLPSTSPAEAGTVLWYDKPATKWSEALPVGNGRLGAMIFGGAENERVQLNEQTIWAGGPYDPTRPGGAEALPEIRRLVFQRKFFDAEALFAKTMMGKADQMKYQPLGNLFLEFPGHTNTLNCRRRLDLDLGRRVFDESPIDADLVDNHFALNDKPLPDKLIHQDSIQNTK